MKVLSSKTWSNSRPMYSQNIYKQVKHGLYQKRHHLTALDSSGVKVRRTDCALLKTGEYICTENNPMVPTSTAAATNTITTSVEQGNGRCDLFASRTGNIETKCHSLSDIDSRVRPCTQGCLHGGPLHQPISTVFTQFSVCATSRSTVLHGMRAVSTIVAVLERAWQELVCSADLAISRAW